MRQIIDWFGNNINTLTFMITFTGFYFAYFQWKKTNRDKRIHFIKLINSQLDCIGPWMSVGNYGYREELTEEQKFDNANPFKLIFDTGSSPIINSTLLEEMSNVDKEIIGEINQLYYDLKRIESIQNFRNLLVSSDIYLSLKMRQDLINYQAKNSNINFFDFIKTLKNQDENTLALQLLTYATHLHCKVIGNKDTGARQHWEKIKAWIIKESKEKNDWLFIFLTFVFVFLFFTGLINLFPQILTIKSGILYFIFVIFISLILSYTNKAFVFSFRK